MKTRNKAFESRSPIEVIQLFRDYAGIDLTDKWFWNNYDAKTVGERLNQYMKLRGDVVHRSRPITQGSRNSTQCVLAIQRLQDASSGLGAMIERKHAYAFAFISLYIGLVSTIVSTAIGLQVGTSTENIFTKPPCSLSAK